MFEIKDWAGNRPFNGKRFKTFESAWDFLYDYFIKNEMDIEEWEQEYIVCEM